MQNSTQIRLEFPTVMGQPFEKLPEDLFIPPNALEICLETFSGPMDLLLYLIKKENINILELVITMQQQSYYSQANYIYTKLMVKSRILYSIKDKSEYSKKRKKVDVIIFRICNKGENILLGAPCENCQRIMREGIKKKGYTLNRVYYTNKMSETFSCIKKINLK